MRSSKWRSLLFSFQFSSIDLKHMGYHECNTTCDTVCKFWINSTYWITEANQLTLRMSGKAFIHSKLVTALTEGLEPKRSLSDFKLIKENKFPTKNVIFECNDFPASWSCREKAEKCKKILIALENPVIISKHIIPNDKLNIFSSIRLKLLAVCLKASHLKINFEGATVTTSGANSMFNHGFIQSQNLFNCFDQTIDAFAAYVKESKTCAAIYGKNDSVEYSLLLGRRQYEYVRKKMSNEIPQHFLLACSERLPIVTVHLGNVHTGKWWESSDSVYCGRSSIIIIKSLTIIPACHKFAESCLKIFECLERQSLCPSKWFGLETRRGFLVDSKFTTPKNLMKSCLHWGVDLTTNDDNDDKKSYCVAKRVFKLESFSSFCQSYEWICKKVLHCIETREVCTYTPNNTSNNSIMEDSRTGIYNFQMPRSLKDKNPRKLIRSLFKCNKKYGYTNHVSLSFATAACTSDIRHCDSDTFKIKDKRIFEWRDMDIKSSYVFKMSPSIVMRHKDKPSKLLTLWSCKRDVLSVTSCQRFLKICEIMKHCLSNKHDQQKETLDLPPNDACYSPLPVNTLNPHPGSSMTRGHHFPGITGPALNYILPLETSYTPRFDRVNNTAWEKRTGIDVRKRRTNLFFDIFLEDCRYKHQFEGFLIEPYFAETIDYLMCVIPFGLDRYGENPSVKQGCSHIWRACENMKKCYVHHAKYFGFDSFFNRNAFALALMITITFLLSTASAILTQYLLPVKILGFERLVGYVVYTFMGFTSISLLVFSVENFIQLNYYKNDVSIAVLLPTMRFCWHLGGYFLTMAFHVYVVCFTCRFVIRRCYQTLLLITSH